MAILAGDHSREGVNVRHSPVASENLTNNQPYNLETVQDMMQVKFGRAVLSAVAELLVCKSV